MNFSSGSYLGKNPAVYARKVLKECGLKEPPICEKSVARHLGLEIKEFSLDDVPQREDLSETLKTTCAWLEHKPNCESRIWVRRDMGLGRKRMSVFHECGHAILPWHKGLDYLCDDKDIEPTVQSQREREAFACASEFLMPREMFVEDALSLEISISAIEQLSHHYLASREATAIRFASIHPGRCAIVMVQQVENQKTEVVAQNQFPPEQLLFHAKIPSRRTMDDKKYDIRVKYFVKSHRFPTFIYPRTGIEKGNAISEAWTLRGSVKGEIPASIFGSSATWSYKVECLPLGKSGMVLALLWLPDNQLKIDF